MSDNPEKSKKVSPDRELKPGKILVIAGKTYKGHTVTKTQDEKGKEKTDIIHSKTCNVPASVIEASGFSDKMIEKSFVALPAKTKRE